MKSVLILVLGLVLAACAAPPVAFIAPVPVNARNAALAPQYAVPGLASAVPVTYWIGGFNQRELHAVDPTTGKDVPGVPPFVLGNDSTFVPAFVAAEDGQHLAVVVGKGESCESWGGGLMCLPRAEELLLFDLPAWRVVTATLPVQGWTNQLAYTPDSARLAMVVNDHGNSTLLTYESGTGALVAQRSLDFRPTSFNLTLDGKNILLYGAPLSAQPGMIQPAPPRVVVADTMSLEPVWTVNLPDILDGEWCVQDCGKDFGLRLATNWDPAIVFSPRLNQLYIVHADADKLTTVDLRARTTQTRVLVRASSWFEDLLSLTAGVAEAKGGMIGAWKTAQLDAAGGRLTILTHAMEARRTETGYWTPVETDSLLQSIDPVTGRILVSTPTQVDSLRASADARYLFLEEWIANEPWVDILDSTLLKPVARIKEWQIFGTRQVDGQPIIVGIKSESRQTQLGLVDSRSFKLSNAWIVNRYPMLLTP